MKGGGKLKARITVDLPVELVQWLKKQTEKEKISRNLLIERALEKYKAELESESGKEEAKTDETK